MPHPFLKIYILVATIQSFLKPIWDFLNTNFSAALFGAFAGAYGAFIFAKWQRQHEEIRKEIQATNAAIMLSHDIANAYFSFKKQFVLKLKKDFDFGKDSFLETKKHAVTSREREPFGYFWIANKLNGTQIKASTPLILDIVFDLNTLSTFFVPTEILQDYVFQKITLNGKPLHLATTLMRTVESLSSSLDQRSKLIEQFSNSASTTDVAAKAHWYYGLPDGSGVVNTRFSDNLEAIFETTDDCIQYSQMLGEELRKHGLRLKRTSKKLSKIHINEIQYQKAKDNGLLPDPKKYSDWDTMYVEPKKPEKWWKQKLW